MAPVLDNKCSGICQYQLRILLWNANDIHRELPLMDDFLESTNVDVVCIQVTSLKPKDKTPELINFSAVRRDRPVQGEARGGGLMIYIRKHNPYKVSHPLATNSSAMEKLTIEISTPSSKRFNVSNWYLPPENSHYLQRRATHCRSSNQIPKYTR